MENPFEIHMQNAEDHILMGFLWFHNWQTPQSNFGKKIISGDYNFTNIDHSSPRWWAGEKKVTAKKCKANDFVWYYD